MGVFSDVARPNKRKNYKKKKKHYQTSSQNNVAIYAAMAKTPSATKKFNSIIEVGLSHQLEA